MCAECTAMDIGRCANTHCALVHVYYEFVQTILVKYYCEHGRKEPEKKLIKFCELM